MASRKRASNPDDKNTNPGSVARCVWTTGDDETMLRTLKNEKVAGNQSGAGWKKQVWTAIAGALQEEGSTRGGPKTPAKCNDHWSNVSLVVSSLAVV